MVGRPASAFIASVLLIVQLLLAPFADAAPVAMDDAHCVGTSTAMHDAMDSDSAPTTADTGHPCGMSDVDCRCHCAHSPALSVPRLASVVSPQPDAIPNTIVAANFDPPLFEVLRPPN
jgi:hypothetical protein